MSDYLKISSILLLVEGVFLFLFWGVHGQATGPDVWGVYSLFGINHPPHNVFYLPRSGPSYLLVFAVINSVIILAFYRRGEKWAWYLLLVVYLGLIVPPTIGAAISPGIGAEYYKDAGGMRAPWYNEVSLQGVVIPWVLFLPGILLGLPNVIRNGRRQLKSHAP